jgi:hypothetical protein
MRKLLTILGALLDVCAAVLLDVAEAAAELVTRARRA